MLQVSQPYDTVPEFDHKPWQKEPITEDSPFHVCFEDVYVPDVGTLVEVVRFDAEEGKPEWAGLFRLRAPNNKRLWLTADVDQSYDEATGKTQLVVTNVKEHLTREHHARHYLVLKHRGEGKV